MDKETTVHIHSGILLSQKKRKGMQCVANMEEAGEYHQSISEVCQGEKYTDLSDIIPLMQDIKKHDDGIMNTQRQ